MGQRLAYAIQNGTLTIEAPLEWCNWCRSRVATATKMLKGC